MVIIAVVSSWIIPLDIRQLFIVVMVAMIVASLWTIVLDVKQILLVYVSLLGWYYYPSLRGSLLYPSR